MVEEKGYPIKYKIVNGKSIPPWRTMSLDIVFYFINFLRF
jgi:hypothetical protein